MFRWRSIFLGSLLMLPASFLHACFPNSQFRLNRLFCDR